MTGREEQGGRDPPRPSPRGPSRRASRYTTLHARRTRSGFRRAPRPAPRRRSGAAPAQPGLGSRRARRRRRCRSGAGGRCAGSCAAQAAGRVAPRGVDGEARERGARDVRSCRQAVRLERLDLDGAVACHVRRCGDGAPPRRSVASARPLPRLLAAWSSAPRRGAGPRPPLDHRRPAPAAQRCRRRRDLGRSGEDPTGTRRPAGIRRVGGGALRRDRGCGRRRLASDRPASPRARSRREGARPGRGARRGRSPLVRAHRGPRAAAPRDPGRRAGADPPGGHSLPARGASDRRGRVARPRGPRTGAPTSLGGVRRPELRAPDRRARGLGTELGRRRPARGADAGRRRSQ